MARHKVLVIVPFPLTEKGMANRRAQLTGQTLDPDIEFYFKPVKTSGALLDSNPDFLQLDVAIYEAGIDAERDGYSAVCIDTVSDSGMKPLRSRLSIPVIGPGQAMFHLACQLGQKFSILSMTDGTVAVASLYRKLLGEYELGHRCASIRLANAGMDWENLMTGKEAVVFPKLEAEARKAIEEDGADVICLGSTTMHQSHGYLREHLAVPVLNPGPISYHVAELMLKANLRHSKAAYPSPRVPADEKFHAMLDAAAKFPWPR
jgi:allantoin racemase